MGSVLLSNPPYNLKWEPPSMAGFDQRFIGYGIPPKSNANYAFILTGVNLADKSCFLLPLSVLSPKQLESDIIKMLVSEITLKRSYYCRVICLSLQAYLFASCLLIKTRLRKKLLL